MQKTICVIEGDGIGPEIMKQAIKVLDHICQKYDHKFEYVYCLAGGVAIDSCGVCLPNETKNTIEKCDSVLLGAVGGPKWDNEPSENRPEKALLNIRKQMQVFANIRPSKLYPQIQSPLRAEIVEKGIDFVVVRELVSGVYFGEHSLCEKSSPMVATDVMKYDEEEIKRVAKYAFEIAKTRKKLLTVVDKANVLATSRLWRKVVGEMQNDYPDVNVEFMYVDNCAMQLVKNPSKLDVILTENMFGDILSDEASALVGSIGLSGSASLGENGKGMYEAIHGSAPDIAGKDIANPLGMILSVAMMLKYSFGLDEEAQKIDDAVQKFLQDGYATADIYDNGKKLVACSQVADLINNYV